MDCSKFNSDQTAIKAAFATKWASNITYFGDYVTEALNTTISGTYGMVEVWDTLLCEVRFVLLSFMKWLTGGTKRLQSDLKNVIISENSCYIQIIYLNNIHTGIANTCE